MSIRLRRGTDADRQTVTFLEGELVYTTDTKEIFIGDGITVGGIDLFALLSSSHNHDTLYYTKAQVASMLAAKLNITTFDTHANDTQIHTPLNDSGTTNDVLWSAAKIITELSNKSSIGHTHDDRYYTESEIDSMLTNTTDEYVKVSFTDTTPGYLDSKIANGDGIELQGINPASNERLEISAQVYVDTINGQLHPVFNDTNRNKVVSVNEAKYLWAEGAVSNNEWMQVGPAADADSGYVMPHDAVIIGATLHCENDNGNTKPFRLYVDGTQVNSNIISTTGVGENKVFLNNLDITVLRGEKVRLRAGGGGSIQDVVITLHLRWWKQ